MRAVSRISTIPEPENSRAVIMNGVGSQYLSTRFIDHPPAPGFQLGAVPNYKQAFLIPWLRGMNRFITSPMPRLPLVKMAADTLVW